MLKYKYIYQNADCSLKKLIYRVIYCNFRHTRSVYTAVLNPDTLVDSRDLKLEFLLVQLQFVLCCEPSLRLVHST